MKNILKQILLRIWLIPATYLVVYKMKLNEKYPITIYFSLVPFAPSCFDTFYIARQSESS
jgi:hypothetical protein